MRKRVVSILLFACITAFSFIGSSAIAAPDYLTYEEFISFLEQGKIKSVEFRSLGVITGLYLDRPLEKEFRTHYIRDASNDPLLKALLNEKGVDVSISVEDSLRSLWAWPIVGIIMILLPIVILIFILRINAKVNRLIKKETQPH